MLISILCDPKNYVISLWFSFFQSIDSSLNVIQNENEGIKGAFDFSSKGMWPAISEVPQEQG